jgi:Glycosyl hydrolase family 26
MSGWRCFNKRIVGNFLLTLIFVLALDGAARADDASGTTIPNAAQITDSNGTVWTLDGSGNSYENGNPDGGSYITLLLYYNSTIYADTTSYGWFENDGSGWYWIQGDPQAPSGSNTTIPSATELVDGNGTVWTVDGNGSSYENGVPDGGGGIAQLLFYNSTIYANNTSGDWWENDGSGWYWIQGDPRGNQQQPPSPNGTTVPPAAQIVDNNGTIWTVDGGHSYENGVADGGGGPAGNIALMLYYNGTIYVHTSNAGWWENDGSGWYQIAGDPRGNQQQPPSPNGTTVPPAAQIVDNNGTIWTLDGSGNSYENGVRDGGGNITQLLFYNSTIYANNTSGDWWENNGSGWYWIQGDPRIGGGPVNGVCGSANGTTTNVAPTNNLCSAGSASAVSGNGPWNWNCAGSGGGRNSPTCEAYAPGGGGPANPNLSNTGRRVLQYLYNITGNHTISGVETFGGADFGGNCGGLLPGFMQNDYVWAAWNGTDWTDINGAISKINPILINHWNRGGLVGMEQHFRNPVDGTQPPWQNGVAPDFNQLLTPGTPSNLAWRADLDQTAAGLAALQDAGVVVLWRPFHEMNGQWFWWSYAGDTDGFKRLWIDMFNYFTYTKGLNNLLWVYAPNAGAGAYTDWYPGSQYVDITGLDFYPSAASFADGYNELADLGQPIILAEVTALSYMDWSLWPDVIRNQMPKITIMNAWGGDLSTQHFCPNYLNDPLTLNSGQLQY